MQLALAEAQYDLAAELLRFVVPPTDNDNLFASINGAHGVGQQAEAAKNAAAAPPRVGGRLSCILQLSKPDQGTTPWMWDVCKQRSCSDQQ